MSGHSPRPTPTYALGGFGGWNGAHGAEGESHGGRDETRPDTQDVTVVLAVALATLGRTVGEDLHRGLILVSSPIQLSWVLRGVRERDKLGEAERRSPVGLGC